MVAAAQDNLRSIDTVSISRMRSSDSLEMPIGPRSDDASEHEPIAHHPPLRTRPGRARRRRDPALGTTELRRRPDLPYGLAKRVDGPGRRVPRAHPPPPPGRLVPHVEPPALLE